MISVSIYVYIHTFLYKNKKVQVLVVWVNFMGFDFMGLKENVPTFSDCSSEHF